MSRRERGAVEMAVAAALEASEGKSSGTYMPLAGSCTYAPMPVGMDGEEAERLHEERLLPPEVFDAKWSSWGLDRDWPHGRGLWVSTTRTLDVRVNWAEHIEVSVREKGVDVPGAFKRLRDVLARLEGALEVRRRPFVRHDRWGMLLADPGSTGTGLLVSLRVRLPRVSCDKALPEWLADFGLVAEPGHSPGELVLMNKYALGVEEPALANAVMRSVAALCEREKDLEARRS